MAYSAVVFICGLAKLVVKFTLIFSCIFRDALFALPTFQLARMPYRESVVSM